MDSVKKKRRMSEDHKAAIAAGRAEGAVVRRYLETLEARKQPGRRVSRDQLQRRLKETIETIEDEGNPLAKLELIQQRIDLENRLEAAEAEDSNERAEEEFVEVAKSFAERKGITYTAFRAMGVPAAVMKAAGIPQERNRNVPVG